MASNPYELTVRQAKRRGSTIDEAIALVADRQKGQIANRQLRALGLSHGGIQHRVQIGLLHRLDRGVYAVGYVPKTAESRWMTALLRAGDEAALSFRSAAAHWRLRPSGGSLIDITYPRPHRPARGIRFHHLDLPADELTVHEGLRVTTVPRTLFDLAGVLGEADVEVAVHRADQLRLHDRLSLPDLLARHPRRRGTAKLRRVLARDNGGSVLLRSGLEEGFFAVLADSDLPRPITNMIVAAGGERFECDCVWPDARLIVEDDSRAYHSDWRSQQEDKRQDRILTAAGWTVIRITSSDLHPDPSELLADLRRLLDQRSPRRLHSVAAPP